MRIPVVTTNYDGLLEEGLSRQAVTWRDHTYVERLLRGDIQGILHMHGHWAEPDSVLLGLPSYERILADGHAQVVLRSMFLNYTLLFVGFGSGLNDPNFGELLSWAAKEMVGADIFHCRLVRENEVPAMMARNPLSQRVWIIPYGEEFKDLAPFLRDLNGVNSSPTGAGMNDPAKAYRQRKYGLGRIIAASFIVLGFYLLASMMLRKLSSQKSIISNSILKIIQSNEHKRGETIPSIHPIRPSLTGSPDIRQSEGHKYHFSGSANVQVVEGVAMESRSITLLLSRGQTCGSSNV